MRRVQGWGELEFSYEGDLIKTVLPDGESLRRAAENFVLGERGQFGSNSLPYSLRRDQVLVRNNQLGRTDFSRPVVISPHGNLVLSSGYRDAEIVPVLGKDLSGIFDVYERELGAEDRGSRLMVYRIGKQVLARAS